MKLGTEDGFHSAIRQFTDETRAQDEPPASKAAERPSSLPGPEPRDQLTRSEERHSLTTLGKVYGVGGSREVTIFDLSEKGCCFRDDANRLALGDHIAVKIGPIGPIQANVRWRKHPHVGVQFVNPLYPSVLDHIRASHDLRRR
ncbi:PilZ domain-containing protein [Qipengyuania sp. MTN3-11]|uniref:PilZ domain-containing protein n=1 Tax=Qipengyuania sp. MTN3-11 TaxID=3056557 RepID=UPI0036F2A603